VRAVVAACLAACPIWACAPGGTLRGPDAPPPVPPERYDVLIRGGTIYDGSGGPPVVGDVGIRGDTIAAVGPAVPRGSSGALELDAAGLAVAPGFINVLSHAEETLIQDGRAQSDVRQGVTLEILGETSMGPLSPGMRKSAPRHQGDIKYEVAWDTLGQYLAWLEKRGISVNVASLVGAGTVRENVLGLAKRPATPEELERMKALVAQAMDEGALGLSAALIYSPDTFMSTDELVELAKVAAAKGGLFTAHMRNEGNGIDRAIDEMGAIARRAKIPVEIYHLKLSGKRNWGRLDEVLEKIAALRAEGLAITADMYTYPAGWTGFDAAMPKWAQAGGYPAWSKRLRDPKTRARVKQEMLDPETDWDNFFASAGPEGILLTGFRNPKLRPLIGRRLSEVASERRADPADVAMDLVIEDGSRVEVVYFLMSEDNVRRQVALPWVSFCSDSPAVAPEKPFTNSAGHPRAYGSFARLLGKYVRDEKALPLEEAIRKLTSFPADTYRIKGRGRLAAGAFADVVAFDPRAIVDVATFERPHQYATGVKHVLVNGALVLKDGEHTGATPGRAVLRDR
jgi:N-acyl-D-amino-acid deacylase